MLIDGLGWKMPHSGKAVKHVLLFLNSGFIQDDVDLKWTGIPRCPILVYIIMCTMSFFHHTPESMQHIVDWWTRLDGLKDATLW